MKKLLLATLVSTLSIGAAQAEGPTVYGKINVSVDSVNSDLNESRAISVDSNASRFGIKGNEKLTDNLSAIYGIEWGVNIDSADGASNPVNKNGDTLESRNRFIGLSYDGVGALKLGRLDTNFKTLQGVNPAQGVDIFDDYVAGGLDMKNTLAGENRVNNVIAFETAKFNLDGLGTLQGNFLVTPSEKTSAKGAGTPTGSTATSTSVIYTNKDVGIYTGVAYDSNVSDSYAALGSGAVGGTTTPAFSNAFRWVGSLDLAKSGIDGVTLNALFQQAKPTNKTPSSDLKETAYLVSAVYKFPASVLDGLSAKAQWQSATTKLDGGVDDVKIEQIGAGVDYAFSTKTKVFGFLAQRSIKNPNNPASAASGKDQDYKYTAFGLGLEQKF